MTSELDQFEDPTSEERLARAMHLLRQRDEQRIAELPEGFDEHLEAKARAAGLLQGDESVSLSHFRPAVVAEKAHVALARYRQSVQATDPTGSNAASAGLFHTLTQWLTLPRLTIATTAMVLAAVATVFYPELSQRSGIETGIQYRGEEAANEQVIQVESVPGVADRIVTQLDALGVSVTQQRQDGSAILSFELAESDLTSVRTAFADDGFAQGLKTGLNSVVLIPQN